MIVAEVKVKHLSANCILTTDNTLKDSINLAFKESERLFKDKDCVLIFAYLLLKSIYKQTNIKLYLKNDYAKQLYKELKESIKRGG